MGGVLARGYILTVLQQGDPVKVGIYVDHVCSYALIISPMGFMGRFETYPDLFSRKSNSCVLILPYGATPLNRQALIPPFIYAG